MVAVLAIATIFLLHVRSERLAKQSEVSAAGVALSGNVEDFQTLDGQTVKLIQEDMVATVALTWASWCPLCAADLATVGTLAACERFSNVAFLPSIAKKPEPLLSVFYVT